MNVIDPQDPETALDLRVLAATREARINFASRLVAKSNYQDESIHAVLRSDAAYQLSEFYYLLAAFGIRTTSEFDGMIERHNAYVSGLLQDRGKAKRMGLSSDRLLASIFDGETRPRVLEIWERHPGTLDQSSLGRFLVAVMSDETARKTVVAFEKSGLIRRRNSAFRTVLVETTGEIEIIYAQCLRETRLAMTGAQGNGAAAT